MASISEFDPQVLSAIKQTRTDLDEARHLPGFFYTSPEIYQREIETIFMREWLCIGRLVKLQ